MYHGSYAWLCWRRPDLSLVMGDRLIMDEAPGTRQRLGAEWEGRREFPSALPPPSSDPGPGTRHLRAPIFHLKPIWGEPLGYISTAPAAHGLRTQRPHTHTHASWNALLPPAVLSDVSLAAGPSHQELVLTHSPHFTAPSCPPFGKRRTDRLCCGLHLVVSLLSPV